MSAGVALFNDALDEDEDIALEGLHTVRGRLLKQAHAV